MSQQKIFNDPIHGHIEMHPLLVEIIDTPQFQRLRYIKQLGGGYFVYPGASHNRFEHSIGVCHLAGKLIKMLRERQRESKTDDKDKKITEKDVLCVQIAGLCHDLGHGPFSHVFEDFMKETGKEQNIEWMENWEHEEQSVKMFKALLKEKTKQNPDWTIKQLMIKELRKADDTTEETMTEEDYFTSVLQFIEDLIKGTNRAQTCSDKSFLYEIVANKRTGIDVDKMDYLSRDCHHLGMKCNFDHERYMMFARVCGKHICVRDKEARNMYELFHARHRLHSSAYQHPVKKLVERMIVDALLEAERAGFQIPGIDKTITEAVMDERSYLHLTDDILQEIMRWSPKVSLPEGSPSGGSPSGGSPSGGSPSGGAPSGGSPSKDDVLQKIIRFSPKDSPSKAPVSSEAEDLIKRIQTRKLYQRIETKTFDRILNIEDLELSLEKNISKILEELKNAKLGALEESKLKVLCFSLDYGKKEKDPIDSLGFYKKTNPGEMTPLSREEVSHLLPVRFTETKVMLYYKGETKLTLHEEEMKEPLRRCWNILVPNGRD